MSNRVVKDMKTTIVITDESVTCKDQNGNDRWQANLIYGGDIEIIDKRTKLKPKPPLDELTAMELREDFVSSRIWDMLCKADELNGKEHAFLEALFYHDRIREAEGREKEGECFAFWGRGTVLSSVLMREPQTIGTFYFATEQGLNLFLAALGDSVSELRLG